MSSLTASGILGGYKNIVFLGEAGSGKTETAVNIAVSLAESSDKRVCFFDMDQTKPLFRARDCVDRLKNAGVELHFQEQYLDAPTVASGVIEALLNPELHVLMDVGGGSHGSHMIGQFSHILNRPDSLVIYLINPYRAWSNTAENISVTMSRVMSASRLRKIRIAANPSLGPSTRPDDIIEGMRRIRELLPEHDIDFVCVLEQHCSAVAQAVAEPLLPIRLSTLPEWMAGSGEKD